MGPRAFGGQSNLKFWTDHVKNCSAAVGAVLFLSLFPFESSWPHVVGLAERSSAAWPSALYEPA